MINPKVKIKLEEQINLEMYSSYLYIAIANEFEYRNLNGFAKYFFNAAQEETTHAFKIIKYLNDNSEKINLYSIQTPTTGWNTVDDILTATVEHEQLVSERINSIKSLSEDVRDYVTSQFINWFINEQIEEENKVITLRDRIAYLNNDMSKIILYDLELNED